ncbi:MAG TPA: GNAT family N-acetyltransferase [Spirochaetota bacterium]|nr:GNAT family N-acetyltransferase [Spirochaetota bacterium]HPI91181.1 GNAT family N-acetyltransferase [Spirochaetota bacterium]HPR49469.1 GNAT family N-acetyltransferase [Spirochaetota bacterium]
MNSDNNKIVSEFQIDDIDGLTDLIRHTIITCYEGIYPPLAVKFFLEFHSKEKIAERVNSGKVLVIKNNEHIIATGALVDNEIYGVFVHPAHQKAGHGSRIMNSLEKIARENKHHKIELSVSLTSKRFYEARGYTIGEDRKIDVGDGQKLLYWAAEKLLL